MSQRPPAKSGGDDGNSPPTMPQRGHLHTHNSARTAFTVPHISEEEMDSMLEALTQGDASREKTFSRRIVEGILQKYKWYFPGKDKPNGPSLSKAWAYFEHVTLPRHFVGERATGDDLFRADPGQSKDTELYRPFVTAEADLNDWGIGVGLYFTSLRLMAIVFFIAGLINIANIYYYSEGTYSGSRSGIFVTLRGSAICTQQEWVICSNCNASQYSSLEDQSRVAIVTDGNQQGKLLVLKNDCEGPYFRQGLVNFITLLFLLVCMGALSVFLRLRETRFDEDKSTASDYSLVVKNPPPDAINPDEWKEFFAQFADKQITAVTIALNNDVMLRKLVLRRIYRDTLRRILPKGTDLENEDVARAAVDIYVRDREAEGRGYIECLLEYTLLPILRIFGMFLKAETLVDRIYKLTGEIKDHQEEDYHVTHVFVTYETEEGQRAALTALAASKINLLTNNTTNAAPSTLFKGRLLRVSEPTEPSATRWLDMGASLLRRLSVRLLNFIITVGVVAVAGWFVGRTRNVIGPAFSGPLVSIFNAIIPIFVKILMIFERHSTEGGWQASLYLKITLFRWVNTAILTQIITPFTSTIRNDSKDVLPSINAILWAEMWLVPCLRILDIVGNIRKHIIAPRAKTQEEMNLHFQGTHYNLGERYTDFTKVLFLCFFYAALFPATFFFGTAILILQYAADKFCLFRVWAWAPQIGSELAVFSRRFFFSTSLFAFAVVSSYAWAQFPYDNVCDGQNQMAGVAGVYNVKILATNETDTFTVARDTEVVFCSQNWRDFRGFFFPALPSRQQPDLHWMNSSQEKLTTLYGWTSVVALVVWFAIVSGGTVSSYIFSLFRGSYKPKGIDQKIDFSCNRDITAYIPQLKLKGFPFPFLACNIDDLDEDLIGWTDPNRSYDYHNLIFDVPYKGVHRKRRLEKSRSISADDEFTEIQQSDGRGIEVANRSPPIFSVIKYYPPPWKVKERTLQNRAS